jgi:hypothetical protein
MSPKKSPPKKKSIIPDPQKHLIVSLIKSVIRISGFVGLYHNLPLGVTLLIMAEILGIYEELV